MAAREKPVTRDTDARRRVRGATRGVLPERRGERRAPVNEADGACSPAGYAFPLAIQSRSFAPAGFIACLVDTTSIGVIVAKS